MMFSIQLTPPEGKIIITVIYYIEAKKKYIYKPVCIHIYREIIITIKTGDLVMNILRTHYNYT